MIICDLLRNTIHEVVDVDCSICWHLRLIHCIVLCVLKLLIFTPVFLGVSLLKLVIIVSPVASAGLFLFRISLLVLLWFGVTI